MNVLRKKMNREMKWGAAILSLYLFWLIYWLFQKYILQGNLSRPYTPDIDMTKELVAPSFDSFWFGTDLFGRSLFEVLSAGLSYSLSLAVLVSASCLMIGIVIGYLTVVGPKFFKVLFDLITNIVFIFPSILIAILVMSVTGQSLKGLIFALIITGWPGYARIARGETQRVLGLSYVESAKAIGVGPFRLFRKCIIPDILPQIMIHFVLGLSGVVISEAALGFLGLGGSEFSWGALLADAKSVLLEAPYVTVFISLCMAGLIIGLNLLGDGLRDYLDPQG